MALITYTDKATMNENASVPAINKVQASDMNEIKNVVNTNYQEQIIPKSSIVCISSANTNNTSTSSPTAIPLTQELITGSKLRLSSNKIYADEDCTVIATAQAYITSGISSTSTGLVITIRKNGSNYKRAICPIPNNYRMAQITGVEIPLTTGDYIDLGFYSGDKTGITCGSGGDTYITVQEV